MFKLLYSLHLSTTKVKLMKASFGLLLKILQVKYVKSSKGLNGYGPHLIYFSLDVSCLFAQTVQSVGFYFKLLLKTNLHQHLGEGSAHMDLEVGFHCLNTGICFHLRWQALSETKLADTKQSLPGVPCSLTTGFEAQEGYPGMSKHTVDFSVWATEMSAEYSLHD